MSPRSCIAHPCPKKRIKGSGYCGEHKKASKKYTYKLIQTLDESKAGKNED